MKKTINSQLGLEITQIEMSNKEIISTNPLVENGIILCSGDIKVTLDDKQVTLTRKNVFDQLPVFIHVSLGSTCKIECEAVASLVQVSTENEYRFPSKIYIPEHLESRHLGLDCLEGKDGRTIVNIVNHEVEPNSNIAIGEVISDQGAWSSYPPHNHPQPEAYVYSFDKPNGFGISIVGEAANIVKDGDIEFIPGMLNHPQSTAPGYKMHYIWVIRNFEDNPWKERIYQEEHKHLLEEK